MFLIRMAGVPFELLEKLATLNAAQARPRNRCRGDEYSRNRNRRSNGFSHPADTIFERAVFGPGGKLSAQGVMPPAADPPSNTFAACWQNAAKFAAAEAALDRSLNRELNAARLSLMESARRFLPATSFLQPPLTPTPLALQLANLSLRGGKACGRVNATCSYTCSEYCGKNDTLSEFGPESWGATDPDYGVAQT